MADCTFESGDCFEVTGDCDIGVSIEPIVDPDTENVFACGADGMSVIAPEGVRSNPRTLAYNAADPVIANNTETAIATDQAYWNEGLPNAPWDGANSVLAPSAGLYLTLSQATFQEDGDGYRRVTSRISTKDIAAMQVPTTGLEGTPSLSCLTLWRFTAAQEIEIRVRHTAGANLEVDHHEQSSPNLALVRLGD